MKLLVIIEITLLALTPPTAWADPETRIPKDKIESWEAPSAKEKSHQERKNRMLAVHESIWFVGGGLGLTIAPASLLLTTTMEYQQEPNLYIGPLVQVGLESFVLFTASGSVRYIVGQNPKLKPCFEGGLGLALASSSFASAVGVHVLLGMGFDYKIKPDVTLGTMLRANFAPPIKTFFFSWPILMARMVL